MQASLIKLLIRLRIDLSYRMINTPTQTLKVKNKRKQKCVALSGLLNWVKSGIFVNSVYMKHCFRVIHKIHFKMNHFCRATLKLYPYFSIDEEKSQVALSFIEN